MKSIQSIIMDNRIRPYPHFKFPDEVTIKVRPLDTEENGWHKLKEDSRILTCENYSWFPTNVLMGTIDGKFSDTNDIGAQMGSNLGTASIGVIDLTKAISLLQEAGYEINSL